ncbi:hypothetical protein [Burkholderia cepacia]|uniref:hypothetical protein n=1 Tax=Burkholderia cepacia TaxID=292 RepID=UPI00075D9A78|nr:hypothetical protein [Burkholderia cepacia]KVX58762.1 hypothetical protein WL06_07770 [Burkholderia cepacia]
MHAAFGDAMQTQSQMRTGPRRPAAREYATTVPLHYIPVALGKRLSADALFAFDRDALADILAGGRADIRPIAATPSATRLRRDCDFGTRRRPLRPAAAPMTRAATGRRNFAA